MDNAVGDGNVSATEIDPSLFLESRQQFKPDLAIGSSCWSMWPTTDASAWTGLQRLTTPTSLPSLTTGRALTSCSARSVMASVTSVSGRNRHDVAHHDIDSPHAPP
jgi:hypothetical protein